MTPEGRVKSEVKKQLNKLGAYHFWPVPTGLGATTLDCLCFLNGHGFAIETKAPGKRLTPRQSVVSKQINDAGNPVFVVDSVDAAKRLPELLDAAGINLTGQQSPDPRLSDGSWVGDPWDVT